MAINFYSPINLNQNDIEQLIPHKLSSAPSSPSPVSGQMYYNSSSNTLHYHDGTNFIQVANHADIGSGAMSAFIIEDDDGTEVSVSNAEEIKFIGSGITTNWTDTSTGSDGDPFDMTFTVDAAQTGITSILATDLKIGEDNQTKIDFETADEIHFYAANAEQVYVADGVFGPQTDSDVDLGTTGVRWKDAFVDSMTVTGEMQCATLDIGGTNVTSTAAELNILDGVTSTAAELNILDGVTSTAAELNILDGVTSTASELNLVDGSSAGTIVNSKAVIYGSSGELNGTTLQIAGTSITATAAELNILDGVTSTASELNILDGVTSTAAELNILDGVTSSTAELNVLDGITAVVGELNALDIGSTAVGTAVASKAVILDSNKDYTGIRNLTVTGDLTVTGTTTTNNVETVSTSSGVIFEGGSADGHDATLLSVVAGADVTYTLPNVTGYVGLFAADPGTTTISSTPAELNILDGVTSTASELNLVDGSSAGTIVNSKAVVYGSSGEVNATTLQIAGTAITSTAAELNILDGVTSTAAELNILDGVTSTAAELNILDGVTSTAAELNILDGVTSTAAELNILDGVTATAAEINLIDGGTSRTTNAVVDGDGILHNNGGTMEMTKVETFATYFGTEIASQRQVVADIDVSSLTGNKRVTITHGLGTADISVQLYDTSTEAQVFAETARTTNDMSTPSTSVITIDFGEIDPPNDLRAVITSLSSATASGTVAYA